MLTVRYPGVTNAWVMPIKTRIDMLATGIKTPVGIKVAGPDLAGDRAHRARDRKVVVRRTRHHLGLFRSAWPVDATSTSRRTVSPPRALA